MATIEARPAGMTFSAFAAHMQSMINDQGFVRDDMIATVPCGSCAVCCHHIRTEVMPWEPERLAHLSTEPDPEGCHPQSRKLKTRDDGSCVHLSEQGHGCTVYDHRPLSCRVYDCRYTDFLGVTMSYGGRTEPTWTFGVETPIDAAIAAARSQIITEIASMVDKPDDLPEYAARRMAILRAESDT